MPRHVDFVLKQWKAFNRYLLSKFHVSRVDYTLGIRKEANQTLALMDFTISCRKQT